MQKCKRSNENSIICHTNRDRAKTP